MKQYAFILELSQQESVVEYIPDYQHTYYGNLLNTYSDIGAYLFPENFKSVDPIFDARLIGVTVKHDGQNIVLRVASTLSECIQNKETFYFDVTTKDFHVHFPDHKPPNFYDKSNIVYQIVLGFSRTNYDNQLLIDNIPYDKRLIESPQITRELDDELGGMQQFRSFSFSLDNTDQRFEGWLLDPQAAVTGIATSDQKKLRNNLVRYLVQSSSVEADLEDYSKYELVQQGLVSSISDGTIIGVTCKDIRSDISEQIATRTIDTADYPDLKNGVIIPWVFGTKYGHNTICLNKKINKLKSGTETTQSTVFTQLYSLDAIQDGRLVASFQYKVTDAATGYVQVKKNGGVIGSFSKTTTTEDDYEIVTVETTVDTGDTITFEGKVNTGSKTLSVKHMRGYQNYIYGFCDLFENEINANPIFNAYIDSIELESDEFPTAYTLDSNNDMAIFDLGYELFQTISDSGAVSFKLQDKVSIDCTGFTDKDGTYTGTQGNLIDRGMNQIRYLLNKTKDAQFNNLAYDLATWSLYEDDTQYNFKTGISFNKQTRGYDMIDKLANQSLFGKFQINAERKYTWDVDEFITVDSEFEQTQLVPGWFSGKAVNVTYDNILPFFWVQYQNRDDEVEQIQYYDDTFAATAFDRYGLTAGEDETIFKTYLVEQADVLRYAERVHQITDIPNIKCNITLNDWGIGTGVKSQNIQPGDFLQVELLDTGDLGYGGAVVKVISVSPETGGADPSSSDWTVPIDGRIIKWGGAMQINTDDLTEIINTDDSTQVIVLEDYYYAVQ